MNAPTGNMAPDTLDDIVTFLGPIPPDEYEQRRKIRSCRNAASYKVTVTERREAGGRRGGSDWLRRRGCGYPPHPRRSGPADGRDHLL